MVSSWAGGRRSFPGHRCWCLLVITLVCCLVLYILFKQRFSPAFTDPLKVLTLQGHPDLIAEPFVDFIDPDLRYLKRMFYSGGLVSQTHLQSGVAPTSGARRGGQSHNPNVTVFLGQEDQHYNICVPFHAPGNWTVKICVYERKADPMISAYLQDYGVWEKEQVEGMAHVLLRDDALLDRERRRVSMRNLNAGQHIEDVNHTHVRFGLGSGGKEKEEARDQRLSVVDVGCNVGVYTLAAASLGHPVLALDPV